VGTGGATEGSQGLLPTLDEYEGDPSFASCTALVVLPTLNEEAGLERTLASLPASLRPGGEGSVRVAVIDGGSTDGTVAVARRARVPLLRQRGRGKGEALVEALTWARAHGIAHVVVLDADATYPAGQIGPALALLRAGTDLVVGVRRPVWGPPRNAGEFLHRAGNILLSGTASVLSGHTVLDICSGFWGVSTERFAELGLGEAEFAIEAELVVKAFRSGWRVAQIPVEYTDRVGESKLRAWRDGAAIFLSILQFARPTQYPGGARSVHRTRLSHLLSIGLITSSSGAVVACGPSEQKRAEDLARALRTALPQVSVEVSGLPAAVPGGDAGARPPLVVRLPREGPDDSNPPLTIAIHSDERRLSIQLPPPQEANSPRPNVRRWEFRGSWILGVPRPELLAVVTSRLNYDLTAQHRTMLWANGLSGEERTGTTGRPFGPGWGRRMGSEARAALRLPTTRARVPGDLRPRVAAARVGRSAAGPAERSTDSPVARL
jgi:dolichol-phosphate hexosyltransferase